jgi:hypothetical protein
MEKDLVISQTTEKIDNKIEEIEKKLKTMPIYSFKTNCALKNDNDTITNIRTLSVDKLVQLFSDLHSKGVAFEQAQNIIKSEFEELEYKILEISGYSLDNWKDDIIFLIKQKTYINQKIQLQKAKRDLEPLYSKDKQDEIVINNIISSLKL